MLPKGGIEEGETEVEAAEREVKEETGYQNIEALKPKSFKTSTWTFTPHLLPARKGAGFTREGNDKEEQKTVYYFLFRLKGKSRMKTAEMAAEGLEGDWFSFEEAVEKVSFDNLKDVIKAAERELANPSPIP